MNENPPRPSLSTGGEDPPVTPSEAIETEAPIETAEDGGGTQEGTREAEAILEHQREELLEKMKEEHGQKTREHSSGSAADEKTETVSSATHGSARKGFFRTVGDDAVSVIRWPLNYKNWLGVFGLLGSWIMQAIKSAPSMAGKGGGGGGSSHGGGGHGGGGGHH